MIQKKICMVGVFGTGKTSLVQQFIYSKFSERYHSTVGVKIDRKEVLLAGTQVNLLLWDLAGEDRFQGVQASYLRGSSGIVFVVDGTRRETLAELAGLQALVQQTVGAVPAVIAVNKADLVDRWQVDRSDTDRLLGERRFVVQTSAKTGLGVQDAFLWLAGQTLTS
jgi:small GTP-binding protein